VFGANTVRLDRKLAFAFGAEGDIVGKRRLSTHHDSAGRNRNDLPTVVRLVIQSNYPTPIMFHVQSPPDAN
jgi:hypothetical protein